MWGDYGSRNTSFFHPNGFEIMSSISKEATEIANSYLFARSKNLFPIQQDDYTIGHGLISISVRIKIATGKTLETSIR